MKYINRTVCFTSKRAIPIKYRFRHRSLIAYFAFEHASLCRYANEHNKVIAYGSETIFPKFWDDLLINNFIVNNLPF